MDRDSPRHRNLESAKRFREKLKQTGKNQAQFARDIEMSALTVSRWATGVQRPDGIVWAHLDLLIRVRRLTDSQ